MINPTQKPVFVARDTYRQRRMRDLARAVPLIGTVLLLIPLLWNNGQDQAQSSAAFVYVFVVWILLILLAAAISRSVSTDPLKDK